MKGIGFVLLLQIPIKRGMSPTCAVARKPSRWTTSSITVCDWAFLSSREVKLRDHLRPQVDALARPAPVLHLLAEHRWSFRALCAFRISCCAVNRRSSSRPATCSSSTSRKRPTTTTDPATTQLRTSATTVARTPTRRLEPRPPAGRSNRPKDRA